MHDREVIDLGQSRVGTSLSVVVEDGIARRVSSYDAQPILDEAAELRATRQGQRWGNATHIGFIPAAVMGQWARDGRLDDPAVVRKFFRDNPHFCTFDRYLK